MSVDDVDPLAAEDVAEVGHGAHDGREARLVVEGDQGEVVDLGETMDDVGCFEQEISTTIGNISKS